MIKKEKRKEREQGKEDRTAEKQSRNRNIKKIKQKIY